MPQFSCSSCWPGSSGPGQSLGRRSLRFLMVLGAHGAVLWGGMELAARPEVRAMAQEISVRLLEERPPQPQVKPEPSPPARPRVPARHQAPPPPVLTAAPAVAEPVADFVVAPPPQAPPVAVPAAAPEPPAAAVFTAARFDAEYLSNPKPAYPPASRRLGEEGRVLLRVHVSAEGSALAVEIRQPCGFPRLDEAAKAAVGRWRFVPARRGSEAVDSWVAVPIVFSLQTS